MSKSLANINDLSMWRDGRDESFLAVAQLCRVVMLSLPHQTLLHSSRFVFTDVNRHKHSGIDVGLVPQQDQKIRLALKIPSHDHEVQSDDDLELVVAVSHADFSPSLEVYRFVGGSPPNPQYPITIEWLRSQALDLVTLAVRSPATTETHIERLKGELSVRPFLLKDEVKRLLFV